MLSLSDLTRRELFNSCTTFFLTLLKSFSSKPLSVLFEEFLKILQFEFYDAGFIVCLFFLYIHSCILFINFAGHMSKISFFLFSIFNSE